MIVLICCAMLHVHPHPRPRIVQWMDCTPKLMRLGYDLPYVGKCRLQWRMK